MSASARTAASIGPTVPAVVNGNDEYVLEKALKLDRGGRRGRGHPPVDGPGQRARDDAQGAGDGRDARRPRDRPGARRLRHASRRRGSWPRRSRRSSSTWCFAGVDTSDGGGGVVPRRASPPWPGCRTCPTPRRSSPTPRRGTVRVRRITRDRLRRARGADAGPHRRARRRSASRATRRSRGSWPRATRRSRRCRWRTSGIDAATVGGPGRRPTVVDVAQPPARARRREVVREAPDEAARQVVDFLAERRLI